MTHFTLKLTLKQAALVQKALDFYTRIGIGQWQEFITVVNEMMFSGDLPASADGVHSDDRFAQALRDAKKSHLGLEPNAFFGIPHPDVGDSTKILYDVDAVLRKLIATAENHKSISVWHDDPLHLGSEPLAEGSFEKD